MQYKNEIKKKYIPRILENALDQISENNIALMKKHGVILAGGCFTSAFCMTPINDIDVYFKSEDSLFAFLDDIDCDGHGGLHSDNLIVHLSNNALTLMDMSTGMRIQLIFNKMYPTTEDLFNNFDFTVNMCAFDMSLLDTDDHAKLEMNVDFEKHNLQRKLIFNMSTRHPISSANRMHKYKDKGYNMTPHEWNKVCLAIALINIDSWDSFHEVIGGFYGIEETFDYTVPFEEHYMFDYINNNGYLELPINGIYHTDIREKVGKIMDGKK